MTSAPLARGEVEKGFPSNLDPVGAFIEMWRSYETGIRQTSIGAIYGAQHEIDSVNRILSVRSGDRIQQRTCDELAFCKIKTLLRGERITVSPKLQYIINQSESGA